MKVYKFFLAAFLFFIAVNMSAQVAVIANKSVADSKITVSKAADIYLLKSKTWSDGKAVVPLTLKTDNEASNKFFDAIGKSSMELKKAWMKLQLTGEGQAPEGLGSENEILNKVASTPGAIGFISASKVNDNVKVLLTIN